MKTLIALLLGPMMVLHAPGQEAQAQWELSELEGKLNQAVEP